MNEKGFFDHLRNKLSVLRPNTQRQFDDWNALQQRLDRVMPEGKRRRRSGVLLPFLLSLALILSNFFWWQQRGDSQSEIQRLEVKLATLQKGLTVLQTNSIQSRTDTIWQTRYIQVPVFNATWSANQERLNQHNSSYDHAADAKWVSSEPKQLSEPSVAPHQTKIIGENGTNLSSPAVAAEDDPINSPSNLTPPNLTKDPELLRVPELNPLEIPAPPGLSMLNLPIQLEYKQLKPVRPIGPVLLNALKPKYVKVGTSLGLVYPVSPSLKHQIGYRAGVNGAVGFSRKWSVTLNYSYGEIHYEADDPAAILGAPEFPALPSAEFRYLHFDIPKQPYWQFDLGLRYTFSKQGHAQPYIGVSWGSLTLMPHNIGYEVQNESNHSIQPSQLKVDHRLHVRNLLGLNAGLEIPLSRRIDLSIEACYQRQWQKKAKTTTDLPGIQLGLGWKL